MVVSLEEFKRRAREENMFDLYEDEPGWKEASDEIAEAVYEFAKKYAKLIEKYDDYGAKDTASREAVFNTISELVHLYLFGVENLAGLSQTSLR